MTPLGRAFMGACLGAILTLLIHPRSRPFFTQATQRVSPARMERTLDNKRGTLPTPRTLTDASLWIQVGAERLANGERLSLKELETLAKLAQAGSESERQNAFWLQVKAAYLSLLSAQEKPSDKTLKTQAQQAWMKSGHLNQWNDHQSERLKESHLEIVELVKARQAWQNSYLYFNRSDAVGQLIENYAKTHLADYPTLYTDGSLLNRYLTITNGSILRDHSSSIKMGLHGARVVEMATYTTKIPQSTNPKRIWIAKTALVSRLDAEQKREEAAAAKACFKQNEGWIAMTERANPDDEVRAWSTSAVTISAIPGCFAISALFGAVVYGIARLLKPSWTQLRFFPAHFIFIAALLISGLVFLISRSWLAAVSCGGSIIVLASGPTRPRVRKSDDLGPFFNFIVVAIWLGTLVTLSLYLIGNTTASLALIPYLGDDADILAHTNGYLGVTAVILCLFSLAATAWAMVQKYSTPDIFWLLIRRFGALSTIGGMVLVVISTPLCVYADNLCAEQLSNIAANEPIHYLNQ